jgi:DNA polymerase-3 subunit alpha
MVEEFIQRHRGLKTVRYLVPEMKEILSNTFGVLVYQEQIMQLAQKLAGYTLSEADLMRRAMGKKKREEMALHQEKFVNGAVERGIRKDKAEKIFSLMDKFSDYGFPRSHAVAYAYVAFQTAYLKAHYPEHFYAAVLSSEAQDAAKVFKYSKELRTQGIKLLPPDVNESYLGFTPLSGAIRYGLAAIKGLGNSAVNSIIDARQTGPFKSFFDFAERLGHGTLNKRTLEGLVGAGAFDSLKSDPRELHEWRGALSSSIDAALSMAQRARRERLQGQNGLFGSSADDAGYLEQPVAIGVPWTRSQLLLAEKAALGFYVTDHPLRSYIDLLQALKAVKSIELPNLSSGVRISIGGIISDLQPRTTKKGDRFALLRLEDEAGGTKCVLWPETYRKYSTLVANELPVLISGKLELSEDNPPSVIVDQVQSLDEMERAKELIVLLVPKSDDPEQLFDSILHLLNTHPGSCEVVLEIPLETMLVRVSVNSSLRVARSEKLEAALRNVGCVWRIEKVALSAPAASSARGAAGV